MCLTAETAEIAFCWARASAWWAFRAPRAGPSGAGEGEGGRLHNFRADKILALEPDLVLAFSDLQRDIVGELIAAGVTVLCTNQRSVDDVLRAILLIAAPSASRQARALIQTCATRSSRYASIPPCGPTVRVSTSRSG